MQPKETATLILKIAKLYEGTPKPDGWFGAFCIVKKKNKEFLNGQEIRISGKSENFDPTEGMYIKAKAAKETDKYYSHAIQSVTPYIGTEAALTALLYHCSLFKGLPKDTAKKLWGQFGAHVMEEAITGCKNLEGSWRKKHIRILTSGFTSLFLEEAIQEAMPAITPKLTKQLARFYRDCSQMPGDDAPEDAIYIPDPMAHLRENPYYPMQELRPSTPLFKACDSMAVNLGLKTDDTRRLSAAAMLCTKSILESSGGTYLDMEETGPLSDRAALGKRLYGLLYQETGWLYDQPASHWEQFPIVKTALSIAISSCQVPGRLYDPVLLNKEHRAAAMLAYAVKQGPLMEPPLEEINEAISSWCETSGKQLSEEQRKAVQGAVTNRISVITGGPGRGKTEVTTCICHVWKELSKNYEDANPAAVLTAPTGMAAKNMGRWLPQGDPRTPRTIMYRYVTGMEVENSLCILDETSMVSLDWLLLYLEMCLHSQLLFIGDPDQLPSVGAGRVLKDLLDIPEIPVFRLTKCFRTESTAILENAGKIIANDTSAPLISNQDFHITAMVGTHPVTDGEAADMAVNGYLKLIKDRPANTVALLCPVRKSTYLSGTDMLNKRIQAALQGKDKKPVRGLWSGEGAARTEICIGDRVVFTKNLIALKLVNGDCGTIVGTIEASRGKHGERIPEKVLFEKDTPPDDPEAKTSTIGIPKEFWEHLELAYALTIHKSQGSEYPDVIIPLPKAGGDGYMPPGFFSRNLFYTAVTRAKSRVHLIACPKSIVAAINTSPGNRNSSLPEWVAGELEKDTD